MIAGLPDYAERNESEIPSDPSADGGREGATTDGPQRDGVVTILPDGAVVEAAPDVREIPDVVSLGCTAPEETAPIAYFRFEEGAGATVGDCVGGHNGSISAGVTWAAGRIGAGSLAFGGGMVTLADDAVLKLTGAMTVTAWVTVDSFGASPRVVSKGGGAGSRGWELNFESDGTARFRVSIDGTDATGGAAAVAPAPGVGQWMHLAGVYEPSTAVRLYINGVEVATTTTGVPATQHDTSYPVAIGKRAANDCCALAGQIDDVRIFDRPLGPQEVADLAAQ